MGISQIHEGAEVVVGYSNATLLALKDNVVVQLPAPAGDCRPSGFTNKKKAARL
jgi:hypothetical protein